MNSPGVAEKLLDYFERHLPQTLNKALAELNLTDDDFERTIDWLARMERRGEE